MLGCAFSSGQRGHVEYGVAYCIHTDVSGRRTIITCLSRVDRRQNRQMLPVPCFHLYLTALLLFCLDFRGKCQSLEQSCLFIFIAQNS